MKNIIFKIIITHCFTITSFTTNWEAFAKKETHRPQWEEILPEIGKEFLSEETREKLGKIFSPQKKKVEKKDGVEIYRKDTNLRGKLSVPIKILGKGKLEHVTTNYQVTIKEGAVIKDSHLNKVVVGSSLKAKRTTFQFLIVHGLASLKECQVFDNSTIDGDLTADKSTFHSPLQILGKQASFKQSKIFDIKFSPTSAKKILILEESEVRGNIIFEGRTGKVIVKNRSKIYGKVKNGHLEIEGKP